MADINLGVGGANSAVAGGYDIANSVKLEPDNAEYFQRPASGSNGSLTTWTFSLWLKRTELSHNNIFYSQGGNGRVRFESNDTFSFRYKSGNEFTTSRVFRDTSAWYHIVIAVDTTQATVSDRVKIYFNGVQETMSGTQPTLNATSDFGAFSTVTAQLGQFVEGAYYFAGYMAEFYWIDGIQQTPTEFGEFDDDSGIWKPIEYTGSFGSEGVYLDFEDAANLGDDVSGNGNNFTLNNITSADQSQDTPTNNFCTFNAIQNYDGKHTYTNGATVFGLNTDSGSGNSALGSMAFTKGKWYAEFKPTGTTSTSYPHNVFIGAGVMEQLQLLSTGFLGGKSNSTAQGMGYYNSNGRVYRNGGNIGVWGDTFTANDIIGVAIDYRSDATAHVYFAKNGTWQNSSDPATNTSPISMNYGSPFPDNTFITLGASIYIDDGVTIECNFGGYTPSSISSAASDANGYGTFEYAPPSGYYALCTKNLAEYG